VVMVPPEGGLDLESRWDTEYHCQKKYTQLDSGGAPRWDAEYGCREEEVHFTCWVRIRLVFCSCHGYTVGFVHVTIIGFLHEAVSGNHISDPTICTRIMQHTLECGISVGLKKMLACCSY